MSLNLSQLDNVSRLIVEAELNVATGGGGRFQPTGFPDLGPALYKGADGQTDWLLVESPQSMANRLELACWDEAAECYDEICNGIPFIRSEVALDNGSSTTSTVQESHRLASPYILAGTIDVNENGQTTPKELWQLLKSSDHMCGLGLQENRPFLLRNHAGRLFSIDPGCLLHGVWLSTKVDGAGRNKKAICGGKVRFPRLLTAYIEAKGPRQANYGGVKRERIFDQAESGTTDAEAGFGSIPFPRTEFTSTHIRAYFTLDLQMLRTCALGTRVERIENNMTRREPDSRLLVERQGNFTNEEAFMIIWSLYKIERFLASGMTLRSGCAFNKQAIKINEPLAFVWPQETDITNDLNTLRARLFTLRTDEQDIWKQRNITTVRWCGAAPPPSPTESSDAGAGFDEINEGNNEQNSQE